MISFSTKKISNPLSLGEKLKQARQELNLSPEQISQDINVAVKYLLAIESNQYSKLPGEVYAKSFLKAYVKYLGLDQEEFLNLYKTERNVYAKTQKADSANFQKPVERISKAELVITPKIIRGSLIGLLALMCLVYLGVKVKAIITPPTLIIDRPADNLVTDQGFVEVAGLIESEALLEINGQQVLADSNSQFTETVDLQPGLNIIEIKAEKRHGSQTKIYRQVVVVDQNTNENQEELIN